MYGDQFGEFVSGYRGLISPVLTFTQTEYSNLPKEISSRQHFKYLTLIPVMKCMVINN